MHLFNFLMKLMSKRIKGNNLKKGGNTHKCRLSWTHDYFPWNELFFSENPRFHYLRDKFVCNHWCNKRCKGFSV